LSETDSPFYEKTMAANVAAIVFFSTFALRIKQSDYEYMYLLWSAPQLHQGGSGD
jgi:hypothetical protein